MTVPASPNRDDYIGDGLVNTYSYTYKIFNQSSIQITIADDSDVEFPTLIIGTDYTVTGVGEANGGTIVLVDNSQAWLTTGNLTNNYKIAILRVRPLGQDTDIRNQGVYFPALHEDEYDRQIMIDQQVQEQIDRSAKLPITSNKNVVLPVPEDGKVLAWSGVLGDMINVTNSGGDADAAAAAAAASAAAALVSETNAAASEVAAAASAAAFPDPSGGSVGDLIEVNATTDGYNFTTLLTKLEAETEIAWGGISKLKKGADVASTAAMTLGDDGNSFDITGTTTITSIVIKTAGTVVYLKFDAVLTVTSGSNLNLQGNFKTKSGSILVLKSDGTNWIEVSRAGTLKLENGVEVNEISTDGTMGGNSDLAVPTEKAVKTHVATEVAGAATGAITLLTTVSATATNTGDITLEADKEYMVLFNFLGATNSAPIRLRFNSRSTNSDYIWARVRTTLIDGTISNGDGGPTANEISLGTMNNAAANGYANGKLFISTHDDSGIAFATVNGDYVFDDERGEIAGTFKIATVTDFEFDFQSESVPHTIRVYEIQQS